MKTLIFSLFSILVWSQTITLLNTEKDSVSFRGLSVVNENIFWVSGSKGTIGTTTDGGKTFVWNTPKGYETMEFRDVHADSPIHAYILGITQPAVVLSTENSGKNWLAIYKDKNKKAFIDAFDCVKNNCVLIGDAVKTNEFYFIDNTQLKWKKKYSKLFKIEEGEAYFAASGTNIKSLKNNEFIIVSGGMKSRLLYKYQGETRHQEIPIIQGKETTGANGFDFLSEQKKGIIVGGDFSNPTQTMFNMVLFSWNEKSKTFDFDFPTVSPKGYKSSLAFLTSEKVVCCGTTGVEISYDGGKNWKKVSDDSYHSVQKRNENSAILVGSNGKIAMLNI